MRVYRAFIHPEFFDRFVANGSLAPGESYMDGWWTCEALDQFFDRALSAGLDKKIKKHIKILSAFCRMWVYPIVAKIGELQSQGVKGKAVVLYRKSLTTKDMKFSGFSDGETTWQNRSDP